MSGTFALSAPRVFAALLFFCLWLAIGREDFLYQKVKNRRLRQGALAVAGGYVVLTLGLAWAWSVPLALQFMAAFVRLAATNVLLCATAAVVLWYFKVWPAGDVKLFVLLSALLPLTMPFQGVDYWRVFFSALVNIFLPAQVFVFALAVHYFVKSRLVHGRRFLVQLGWRRELAFLWDTSAAALKSWYAQARALALPYLKRPSLSWETAKKGLGHVQQWLFGMAAMALLSAVASQWVESPLVLSIGCTILFAFWGKIRQTLGSWGSVAALAALTALLWGPVTRSLNWRVFMSMFGQISVFSFFLYLGMNAMTSSFNGGSAAAMYVVPLVSMVVMMVIGKAFFFVGRMIAEAWRWLTSWPTVHAWLSGSWAPGGAATAYNVLLPGGLAANVHPPAWIMPMAAKCGVLAGFGMFFGLSLVLVRRWDLESRPTWPSATLVPRLLLAPDFVERLRADDEDFFEEHFSTLYPDGLTEPQVQALSGWCKENAVESVPLAPTLSFASWIFLGFLLCALLGGRHLLDFVTL